jgi:hypothetical protein
MNWDDAIKRISAGEDILSVFDKKTLADRHRFVDMLVSMGREDLAEEYLDKMRELDLGISSAIGCWRALTETQRNTLVVAATHGRLTRVNKSYRPNSSAVKPVYAATIRVLCSHNLMAWDGALRPEISAVVTERGLFVLKHGRA